MNKDTISFDVGTNFDYKLFDIVEQSDPKHSITSFYGKLRYDGLPGGRAAAIVPNLTFDEFAAYVAECNKCDIQFNYLINPIGLDQNELDPVEGKKLRDFIHKCYDIGVRAFTLNSPILIKYVKRTFPDVFVTLGLYAYPTNIQHLEYWRSWGVDEITLDHSFNRKFDLLRKVLTQYKDTDLHLRLIANNLCIRECPYKLAHACFTGHTEPECVSMDYTLVNCIYRKVTTPSAIISSEWIRPEDIHYYRELAEETGNRHLCIKLVDRTRPTTFIERVIKAYMAEKYEGNLLDIVNWPETKNISALAGAGAPAGGPPAGMPAGGPPPGFMGAGGPPAGMPAGGPPPGFMGAGGPPAGMPAGGPPPGFMGAGGPPAGMPAGGPPMGPPPGTPKMRFMERLKPEAMMAYGRTMSFPKLYVDNTKLDGFIEHFIKANNCDKTLCANNMVEPGQTAENMCTHCSVWAKKVVNYDEAEVAQWKEVAGSILRGIEDGSIYHD